MMIKAVIFDMDGVIVDSEPSHKKVFEKILKNLNLEISEEEYLSFIGTSNTHMWTILKKNYDLKETIEELVSNQIKENIEDFRRSNEKPIPGIVDLLKKLKNNDISTAVASSSPTEGIKLVLEKFRIEDYFDNILSGENLKRGKPAPDIFLMTANKLNVEPKHCVVIEDSENGVKAARSAGMRCIGFQNKNSGNQDLSNADIIVNSIEEINLNLIDKLVDL